MPIDPTVKRDIIRSARRHRIDPRAALSVGWAESSLRRYAVGDQGKSYGPFQLYTHGALPKGKNLKWAGSAAGIDYAIRKMAESGARGLTGRAAVEAIVRRFERPADPTGEVRRAMAFYGSSSGALAKFRATSGGAQGAFRMEPDAAPGGNKAALAQFLIQNLSSYAQTGQMSANPATLFQMVQMARNTEGPDAREPSATTPLAPTGRGAGGGGYRIVEAMRQAKKMGLHVGENPLYDRVDPVHTKGSHHYRTYKGTKIGQAADISGDPRVMRAYFNWARKRYGAGISELIYDKVGSVFDGRYRPGAYGGHGKHVHIAFGSR